MIRRRILRSLLAVVAIVLFIAVSRAEVVEKTIKSGEPYTISLAQPGTVVITADAPTVVKAVVTPGNDAVLNVVAASPATQPSPPPSPPVTQPTTSPTTKPIPPPTAFDRAVTPGESINLAIVLVGDGTPGKHKRIQLKNGRHTGPITARRNYVDVVAETDGKVFLQGNAVYGIDLTWNGPGPRGMTFEGFFVQGFGGGARVQTLTSNATFAKDITFRRMRFVDMSATGSREGHGIYAKDVDGLNIIEPYIEGAGAAGSIRDEYVHAIYSKEENKRVVIRDPVIVNAENFGIQVRNSTLKWTDPDDGDPGPEVTGALILDACNGICADGRRAKVTDNVIVARHFLMGQRNNGWSGIYGSVGELTQGGNLRIRSTGKPNRTDGYINSAWRNAPRNDDVWTRGRDAKKLSDVPCKTISNGTPDVDAIDKTVDLSDIPRRARAGESIKALRDEGQARARKAA